MRRTVVAVLLAGSLAAALMVLFTRGNTRRDRGERAGGPQSKPWATSPDEARRKEEELFRRHLTDSVNGIEKIRKQLGGQLDPQRVQVLELVLGWQRKLNEEGFDAAAGSPLLMGATIQDEDFTDAEDLLYFECFLVGWLPREVVLVEEQPGGGLREVATVALEKERPRVERQFQGALRRPFGPTTGGFYTGPSAFPPARPLEFGEAPGRVPEDMDQFTRVKLDWSPRQRRAFLQVRDDRGVASNRVPIFLQIPGEPPVMTGPGGTSRPSTRPKPAEDPQAE